MDLHSPASAVHGNVISNLASTFSASLHIQEDHNSKHASEENDVADGNLSGDFKHLEAEPNKKCLKKCATFPDPDTALHPKSSGGEDEETHTSLTESFCEQSTSQSFARSISLPTPLKLVSAMKGSREKQGGTRMKLSVKWAPDVYDPVPTLLSHTVKNKKQHKSRNKKNDKKNGKKGQKGNSSRGSSGKDKRQLRKSAGTSDMFYKPLASFDKVIPASTEFDALDVGSQDSYCGTSFLKKSPTKMHYSVAEAQ